MPKTYVQSFQMILAWVCDQMIIQPANHQQNLRPLQLSADLIGPLVLPPINSAVIQLIFRNFTCSYISEVLGENCNSNGFESRILTLAPTEKSVKFPNSGGRKRHNPLSPASRTLFVVEILDVSYLKSTVNLEPAGSKNTFAAKKYNYARRICAGEFLIGGD